MTAATDKPNDLRVRWIDRGREPQCAPDPDFPHGIDVDASGGADRACTVALPYPAKRCGFWDIDCRVCGARVTLTTASRRDDPRSVRLGCRPLGTAN